MTTPAASKSELELLDTLQQEAFRYFRQETNMVNGMVLDKTSADWPASIAAIGLGLACYPVAVERGWISRADAIGIVRTSLQFLASAPQSEAADATGYRGCYYHFLDMHTGRRARGCEVSTVDTALLLAGALTCAAYFQRDDGIEREIRDLADVLYCRVDWPWAQNGNPAVAQGWLPESGFVDYRYQGYDEALILYLLGLGAPDQPLSLASYSVWGSSYEWKRVHGIEYLYAGPLFTHQLSHIWVDFRGIQDEFMRGKGIDYFENSRRATCIQQRYAIANPHGFRAYGEFAWGITASDGPGEVTRKIDGIDRRFYDYAARGVPYGPDDGTLAPWAVLASLPFAPDLVLPTIVRMNEQELRSGHQYGFWSTFNPTFIEATGDAVGWHSPYHFGLAQGPILLMIENYRSGLIWELMRSCPYLVAGLHRAGFTGGWLSNAVKSPPGA
ncbi:MAG: glucoamylase family protein [Gemmatimonadales bacterium]